MKPTQYFYTALALALGIQLPAKAQQFSIYLYGVPFTCTASNGQPVPFWLNELAAAAARPMGGARADLTPHAGFTIAIDPQFLESLPRLGAIFTIYHECAHVALPMGIGLMSPMQERNADCYAIQAMRAHGLINSMEEFQESVSAVQASGGLHQITQARIDAMSRCL